jgi:hypothetical protein
MSEPPSLTAEKAPIWPVGYLSSYLLFALGWALLGVPLGFGRGGGGRVAPALFEGQP